MKKETYATPDVELIEIKPSDVISVSVGSDNEIDFGDISGGFF